MDLYYHTHEKMAKPEIRYTYKLRVSSNKHWHNFIVSGTCLRFAEWEAIRRFKEKHPDAVKVTVTKC